MAKRRRLLRALGGGALAVGQSLAADRKEAMLRQRQAEDDARTAERQKEMFALQSALQKQMKGLELASKGDMLPSQAKNIGGMLGIDLSPGIMPEPQRIKKINDLIAAQKLGETRDIKSEFEALELPVDEGLGGGAEDVGPPRMTPFIGTQDRQKAQQAGLLAEDARKRAAEVQQAGDTTGATERAKNAPDIVAANLDIEKRKAQQKIDVETAPGNVKALSGAAASKAAAEEGARKRAGLAPDIVKREADRAYQLAEAAKKAEAKYATAAKPTDSMRRAKAFGVPMSASSATIDKMAQMGERVKTGSMWLSDTPGGGMLMGDRQETMVNAGKDFVNFASLILTGVTARPDEYKRYFSTLIPFAGDDPKTVALKSQNRTNFLNAIKAMAGQGIEGASLEEAARLANLTPADVPDAAQIDADLERARAGLGGGR